MESFIERPISSADARQLGVFVLDGSPSMLDEVEARGFTGSKAEAVAAAVGALVNRIRVSSRARSTSVAGVSFAGRVTGRWGPLPLAEFDTAADQDPTRHGGTGTSLAAGLLEAEAQIGRFFGAPDAARRPASAVVLVLTDGECETPEATRAVAARLRGDARVRVACALFATKGRPPHGRRLLQEICSAPAPMWSRTVHDPETLRRFFRAGLASAAGAAAGSASSSATTLVARDLPGVRPDPARAGLHRRTGN